MERPKIWKWSNQVTIAADKNGINPIWQYHKEIQRGKQTSATRYTKKTEPLPKQLKNDKKDGRGGSKHASELPLKTKSRSPYTSKMKCGGCNNQNNRTRNKILCNRPTSATANQYLLSTTQTYTKTTWNRTIDRPTIQITWNPNNNTATEKQQSDRNRWHTWGNISSDL